MGTLTARDVRMPNHCEHKLPTSCRLSSIPNCCACADERAHSPSYSVYIDGIGYVPRGTRWQRYCWFCKEFWENRVTISGVPPTRTRVPEVPDQTTFLQRWYEFHRGYRIVHKEDGSEERIAVIGEDLVWVSPGHLPRTLEEMRSGRSQSQLDPVQENPQGTGWTELDDRPGLDETLDQMLAEIETTDIAEENVNVAAPLAAEAQGVDDERIRRGFAPVSATSQVLNRTQEYQLRRVAALRRELDRMRSGIERVIVGLRDLGEDVPEESAATSRLTDLSQSLESIASNRQPQNDTDNRTQNMEQSTAVTIQPSSRTPEGMQARVEAARRELGSARRARSQALNELELADQECTSSQNRLQQLQREQRTLQNYILLFGTREEMAAQGDDYESPIGAMFSRAYDRFRHAEDIRREERTLRQVLEDEAIVDRSQQLQRLSELQELQSNLWRIPRRPQSTENEDIAAPQGDEVALRQYYALIRQQEREEYIPNDTSGSVLPPSENTAENTPLRPRESSDRPRTHTIDFREEANRLLQYLQDNDLTDNPSITTLSRIVTSQTTTLEDEETVNMIVNTEPISFLSGTMAARIARRRQASETVTFSHHHNLETPQSHPEMIHDMEMMAETTQMSVQLRNMATRVADMTPDEERDLIRRLRSNQRTQRDFDIIEALCTDSTARSIAVRIHAERVGSPPSPETARRLVDLARDRQAMSRAGDHSRSELDAQRRAAQAFAIAAGRTAMQTGSAALFEQMANRDEETRAAYLRLQENGFLPNEDGPRLVQRTFRSSDPNNQAARDVDPSSNYWSESDEDAQGLDARDTGRPEPKSDEELTLRMECRICYTQVADVACLPCGHLVMCQWCSDQHSPVTAHDRTRPRHAVGCPVCRKGIRQKVRIYRS